MIIDLAKFREEEFTRREKNLANITKQELSSQNWHGEALHVVYVMTHVGICGGTKIILEHVNYLSRYRHHVTIVAHFTKPNWFPLEPRVNYIQVPFTEELTLGIPPCDVIVATYWREISECIARKIAPVVYFEQGDYHLFDWDNVLPREKDYIYKQLQLPSFIYTVSGGAADQLKKIFHQNAAVIHNGINTQIFHHRYSGKKEMKTELTITTIGSENSLFKGVDGIKQALAILSAAGYRYRFIWITPDEPSERVGVVYVNPKQYKIGELLRKTDIYVCNSLYESFSLPVLEAMACGCAVITTPNKGIMEYAVDQQNCLMVKMNDPQDLAAKIAELYLDNKLLSRLSEAGIKTADDFSWEKIIPCLIDYYRKVAGFQLTAKKTRNEEAVNDKTED